MIKLKARRSQDTGDSTGITVPSPGKPTRVPSRHRRQLGDIPEEELGLGKPRRVKRMIDLIP
jgi:hypothetical protein